MVEKILKFFLEGTPEDALLGLHLLAQNPEIISEIKSRLSPEINRFTLERNTEWETSREIRLRYYQITDNVFIFLGYTQVIFVFKGLKHNFGWPVEDLRNQKYIQ